MLGDLQDKAGLAVLHLEGAKNQRKLIVKLDVDDGTNDGDHSAL
jgi:hypothetical protein